MGSGGGRTPSRSSYSNRHVNPWLLTTEEEKGSEERHELSTGAARPADAEAGPPQYLVEADDLYDEDYGEGRLVAPPVLGEAPPSYRDF
ncbi:hypothetical protein GCM10027563_12700 [Parasphingorhabdus pacifica]